MTLLACHTVAIRAWEQECWGAGGKILECMVMEGMIWHAPGDVFLYLSLMMLSQIKTWWCTTWARWPASQIKCQCLIPKSWNDVHLKNRGQLRQSCISNSTHAFIKHKKLKIVLCNIFSFPFTILCFSFMHRNNFRVWGNRAKNGPRLPNEVQWKEIILAGIGHLEFDCRVQQSSRNQWQLVLQSNSRNSISE